MVFIETDQIARWITFYAFVCLDIVSGAFVAFISAARFKYTVCTYHTTQPAQAQSRNVFVAFTTRTCASAAHIWHHRHHTHTQKDTHT